MKYIKLFESFSSRLNSEEIDVIVDIIKNNYREFNFEWRRGRPGWLDINYHSDIGWIFMGLYDIDSKRFMIFVTDKLSKYREKIGPIGNHPPIVWESEFDEFGFDVFVNKWYDLMDEM